MGGGVFEYDSETEGAGFVLDWVCLGATDGPVEVELGSLVATLSAVIEDETELDLCLRTVLESTAFRIRVGDGAPRCEAARATALTRDAAFDPSRN